MLIELPRSPPCARLRYIPLSADWLTDLEPAQVRDLHAFLFPRVNKDVRGLVLEARHATGLGDWCDEDQAILDADPQEPRTWPWPLVVRSDCNGWADADSAPSDGGSGAGAGSGASSSSSSAAGALSAASSSSSAAAANTAAAQSSAASKFGRKRARAEPDADAAASSSILSPAPVRLPRHQLRNADKAPAGSPATTITAASPASSSIAPSTPDCSSSAAVSAGDDGVSSVAARRGRRTASASASSDAAQLASSSLAGILRQKAANTDWEA